MTVIAEDVYSEELTEFEVRALNSLEESIQEDVAVTSKQLEADGYEIIQAGSYSFNLENHKRTFSTAKYTLIIEELEDEFFDIDMWDDSIIDQTIQSFVDGKSRYFALQVSIRANNGIELGSAYLGGLTADNDKDDLTYGGYLRQMVAEAIAKARNCISEISMAA